MLESDRQRLILDLLDERSSVTVQKLTESLDASAATIRRDLQKLAANGRLTRVHGGAVKKDEGPHRVKRAHLEGSAFLVASERNTGAKLRIAEKAVSLCQDGESIIINGGSSTYMMAEALQARELSILTNSLPLAYDLLEHSDNKITLVGGELFAKQKLVLSPFDNELIKHYRASKMFMGTPGIGEYGVMESDPLLVRAEREFIAQADDLVVLADSSKLGHRSSLIVCALESVSTLITDDQLSDSHRRLFESAGIDLIVV